MERKCEVEGLIFLDFRRERQSPEHVLIEFPKNEHGPLEKCTFAIFLYANIGTDRAPPYFLGVKKDPSWAYINLRFKRMPLEEVFEHISIFERRQ